MKLLSLSRQIMLFMGLLILVAVVLITVSGFWLVDRRVHERLGDTPEYSIVLQAEREALIPLVLVSGAVAAILALAAGLFVRSRIAPLTLLSRHAERHMARSDLQTPVSVVPKSREIASVASILEMTRVQLLQDMEALADSRQWSETLIQSVVEGIITCDAEWRVVFFSAGAERISGRASETVVGKSLDEALPMTNEEGGRITEYVPADGGRRTVLVRHASGSPITLAITRAKHISEGQTTIVIHDMSEENRRRKAQTYFLANMSHEFRTPLAGMKASVELLQDNLRNLSVQEMQQLLNSVHLSLTMLHQLIDNLLESSKLEANHFALNRRATELEGLLGEAIRVVEPMIVRREQRLTLEEPLAMPTLWVDPTRTIQLIVNLLSNASKYSPVGSEIDVMVERQDGATRVSVADRGRGIAKEKQSSIFQPFVRLEPTSSVDHGSGIGLSVVKAIVEAQQGQVGVEARAGGGSVFWVTLPLMVEKVQPVVVGAVEILESKG
jgi:two-component system sensor histidine kinase ResE